MAAFKQSCEELKELEDLKKNPPCNAGDNLHAGLIVIEAWFRGY